MIKAILEQAEHGSRSTSDGVSRWSSIRLKHAENSNRTAISMTSQPSGLSGSNSLQSRSGIVAHYREALGRGTNHRLALSEQEDELRDYERLCQSSQAMIYAVMSRLMLRRLARA